MSGSPPKKDLDAHAAALVNRARVGDQNAMALIKKVGVRARSGESSKARKAFSAIQRFIEKNPVIGGAGAPNEGGQFGYGGTVSAVIPPAPTALMDTAFSGEGRGPQMGDRMASQKSQLPPLPKGALDRLGDPDAFQKVVIACCKYDHGLDAAAVVLASGPTLSAEDVQGLGLSGFGSEAATQAFFMGVKYPLERDMVRMKEFDVVLKRAFVVGQCVGRAWRIQAVRRPGSRIGLWSPGAGWELGEPFAVSKRQPASGSRATAAPQKRRWVETPINRDTELGQMS